MCGVEHRRDRTADNIHKRITIIQLKNNNNNIVIVIIITLIVIIIIIVVSIMSCSIPQGIQGHEMYIDESGDSEANYTVLALTTDPSADPDDVEGQRILSPIGYFYTRGHDGPVRICSL